MWARLVELGLGAWLFASPFVLPGSTSSTWLIDFVAGTLLVVSTGLNYRYRSIPAHLALPLLGACLIVLAFLSGPHPLPLERQNHILVGLTLMMLGIVPNSTLRPPESWQRMRRQQAERLKSEPSTGDSGRPAGGGTAERRSEREERETVSR